MHVVKLAFVILSAATLAACGSTKDASKSNFEAAINKGFAHQCTELGFSISQLIGSQISKDGYPVLVADDTANREANAKQQAPFEALVKAGVLTSEAAQFTDYRRGRPAKAYALTDVGKQSLRKEGHLSFCVGHRHV